jgi:hypothetical protein
VLFLWCFLFIGSTKYVGNEYFLLMAPKDLKTRAKKLVARSTSEELETSAISERTSYEPDSMEGSLGT